MKSFKALILLFAITVGVSGNAVCAESSAVGMLIDKAHSLEGRGRYDLAAQTWQQVLSADPNEPEALAGLARLAERAGKTDEAATYLERLRKVDPRNPALAEIQALKPASDERGRLEQAARLAANQQYAPAMAIYREVFGDDPPPGGWAIAYYETEAALPGGWEKATAGLRRLTDRYPAVQEYKLSLGRLLTYRPATRLSGVDLLEAVQGVASEKARQAWRQALVWEKANPAFLASMQAYVARYQDPEIQVNMQVAGAHRAEAAEVSMHGREEQRGYEALKQGNTVEATKCFEAALQENANSSQALAGMGYVRMKQQNFADAAQFFEKAKHIAPQDKTINDGLETARFWANIKAGTTNLSNGNENDAVASFKAALEARPSSPEAMQGLAGALIRSKKYSEALPLYERLVQMQSNNADAWRQLMTAKFQAEGPGSALTAMRLIPDAVALKLSDNIEYLALTARIYSESGEEVLAQKTFGQMLALVNQRGEDVPASLQVEIAGLMLRFKRSGEAAQRLFKLTEQDPENMDAWEVLLAALVQNHRERAGVEVLQRMPETVYNAGLSRPGFLRSVAAIQTASGKLEDAEEALSKLADEQKAKGSADAVGTELQLANVYLKEGHADKAEELLNELTDANPDNSDVWKAFSAMLHERHRDLEVLALRQRMPRKVAAHLMGDYDYLAVLASAQNVAGNPDGAMRVLNGAIAKARAADALVPVSLELQLSWLLLESPQGHAELFSILEQMQSRPDLTPSESKELAELWSTWIERTADGANAAGNLPRALAVLEQGCRMFPNDTRLKRSFAGYLLKAGETQRALNIYKNWGLTGASASDYAGAIGAAMNQRDTIYANAWLRDALAKYPSDAQILNMAGKQAAAGGDYKKAKAYWVQALASAQQPQQQGTPSAAGRGAATNSSLQLRQLLLGNSTQTADGIDGSNIDGANQDLRGSDIADRGTANPGWGNISQPVEPVDGNISAAFTDSQVRMASYNPDSTSNPPLWTPQSPRATPQLLAASAAPAVNGLVDPNSGPSQSDAIQDELASIEGRNTPYLGNTDTIQYRSGQPGFDRMLLEQANIEASTTMGDQIRVALDIKPTYVQSGTADGQSTLRFGTAAVGEIAGLQTASGLAADGQLSSQTFGMHFGLTPEGFLVKNFVGGVRFTPANGPFTFMLDRESINDTLLSFAGAKDPASGTVWGGVVADTASAHGHWGTDQSGFYASTGYQWISGKNVEQNTRIDGNAGTYWKVLTRKNGALTVGLNLYAMHYDKNLRYFTIGQGGYFSPQQYFLFNTPIRWVGTYKQRLQYTITASLGLQHFTEDQSAYFPITPWTCSNCYYPAQASNGANYNFEARVAYQLSPNWFVGAFLNANNARDYSTQSAAIFVKYSFEPRPLFENNNVPSVPDWRGQQPFGLY